jgi:GT2 family glycosyltransferase
MTPPKVSVIVPTFNRASLVAECLGSVLTTRYSNLEILVVDDGSSDRTEVVVERFRRSHPEVIRYLTHAGRLNLGVSASRNLGLKHATGEFVCFLDSDDLMLPCRFDHAVPYLLTHPEANGLFEAVQLVSAAGLVTLHDYFSTQLPPHPTREELISLLGVIPSPGLLVRRSIFGDCGTFDTAKRVGEDFEMWLRMSIVGRLVAGLPGVAVAQVRKHSGNTSAYSIPIVELQVLADVFRWARVRSPASVRRALKQKYFALLYYYLTRPRQMNLSIRTAFALMCHSVLRFPSALASASFWANLGTFVFSFRLRPLGSQVDDASQHEGAKS